MRSLKGTLMLSILGGVTLAVVAAGAAVYLVARSSLRAQFDEALLDRARTLAALVTDDEGILEFEYDHPPMEANLGALVRITADDGSVLVQSPQWPADIAIAAPAAGSGPVLARVDLASGSARGAALTAHASRESGAPAGEAGPPPSDRLVTVEVISRTGALRRAEAAVLAALVIGGCFAIGGASAAVVLGVRRGLAPVRDLGAAVDQIDATSLALPPRPGDCPQELTPIVLAVERLLDRLSSAIERERRFTDAAAHELRTPIAELRTITDVAARWPEAPRLRRAVQDAGVVVRQMEGLLDSLLAAARGEDALGAEASEPVSLLPLARAIADEVRRRAAAGVTWTFEGDESATWRAPQAAVASILRNLLDNAAEYTPEGGAVRIGAYADGTAARLVVESGPVTLDAAQVQRIFEPFWRCDEARSSAGHRGLGLAIVDTLARALRLRRLATLTPASALCITLEG